MKRLLFIIITCLTGLATANAQLADPVHFTTQLKATGNQEADIIFSATIDEGWHVYSTGLGNGGPVSATFTAVKMQGAVPVGKLQARGKEIRQFDKLFDQQVRYFEHTVTFVQKIRFTEAAYTIECFLEYGACNDEMCLPPSTVDFKTHGTATVSTDGKTAIKEVTDRGEEATDRGKETTDHVEATAAQPDTITADSTAAAQNPADTTAVALDALWTPVTDELQSFDDTTADDSLLYIFLAGLLGGFLALLTPCVWPIIPMTVSFFLKRNKNRAKAIREALTYALSIIVIYVALGLLVTALFGANALNALSTNAWFNIFFALLLVVFAASFFGAFELTLPSSWSTKIDEKADSLSMRQSFLTAHLSIFLMAFTLVLVSFSCTGPIIGFLLVTVSTQGNILGPTLGMLGFSIGLAIPFGVFALFPSLLKSAPKSGEWMTTVKVVLGFVELAFALKFLSVADLAYGWRLLDREVFLALWIALFGLLGAYLMGWLHFSGHGDGAAKGTPVPQFFLGLLSFAFTIYMIPGLWGAPLKAISAFAPPMFTQDFNLQAEKTVEAAYTDYEQGMAAAREQGKPVIIDFTGFGCVNCRKMEAAVWSDAGVAERLTKDYVLISLYVDDKTPLPQPIEVSDGNRTRTLRTVGDKWSYLQARKFGANTQPFYVLLTPDGHALAPSRSYDEDVRQYTDWLDRGLERFQTMSSTVQP